MANGLDGLTGVTMLRTRWTALAVLLALQCDSAPPTGPQQSDATGPSQPVVDRDALPGFTMGLSDLRDRVLPTFGSSVAAQGLSNAIEEIGRRISGSDPMVFDSALARAHEAATQVEVDSSLGPDVEVVRLLLDQIKSARVSPVNGRSNQ